MVFFNWFRGTTHKNHGAPPATAVAAGPHAAPPNDGKAGRLGAGDSTAARLKSERARLRELLYNVVRESMVRVGVLSSSFKFKVLATDPRGRKFIVMMDLSRDFNSDIAQLMEIEGLIRQAAKARHDITVSAVYWRCDAMSRGAQTGVAPRTTPSPVIPGHKSTTVPDAPAPPSSPPNPAFDPVLSEEVSALRRALSVGTPVATPPRAAPAPASPARLTGFENTEIIESRLPPIAEEEEEHAQPLVDDEIHLPALSPTQYGDLR